ncbi:ESX secretion-associated protein EspG [Amycolatopsis sp. K13G38]|uniref:ESX secretion-associated protein EspG n=1 Tax=Amycolatopsis acididurans TaxID=2724524 RepID=A0ABX1IUV8_9PSEU|nr:ESX secretion-associated protein EspG [Amycolatopsis acididurans]NKQ51278.1 ESX secretion-associated protein EspG [Amycolatopsis acididurans]
MVSRFDFTMGSVEASVVGRAMNADIRRFPLRVSDTTIDPVRYAHMARRVHDDLERRRLSVSGELHKFVVLAFELLGRARVSLALGGHDERCGELAMVAATDGAQALTIGQGDGSDELWFSLFPDEELVGALAGTLPGTAPAAGGPLSIEHNEDRPKSAMAALREAEREFDDEETEAFDSLQVNRVLRARGGGGGPRRPSDAERLEEILAAPRLGSGYFLATGVGRHGESRSAQPLTWLHTEDGRYLVETTSAGDGTMIIRYVPTSSADVADAIKRMIATVY